MSALVNRVETRMAVHDAAALNECRSIARAAWFTEGFADDDFLRRLRERNVYLPREARNPDLAAWEPEHEEFFDADRILVDVKCGHQVPRNALEGYEAMVKEGETVWIVFHRLSNRYEWLTPENAAANYVASDESHRCVTTPALVRAHGELYVTTYNREQGRTTPNGYKQPHLPGVTCFHWTDVFIGGLFGRTRP